MDAQHIIFLKRKYNLIPTPHQNFPKEIPLPSSNLATQESPNAPITFRNQKITHGRRKRYRMGTHPILCRYFGIGHSHRDASGCAFGKEAARKKGSHRKN